MRIIQTGLLHKPNKSYRRADVTYIPMLIIWYCFPDNTSLDSMFPSTWKPLNPMMKKPSRGNSANILSWESSLIQWVLFCYESNIVDEETVSPKHQKSSYPREPKILYSSRFAEWQYILILLLCTISSGRIVNCKHDDSLLYRILLKSVFLHFAEKILFLHRHFICVDIKW